MKYIIDSPWDFGHMDKRLGRLRQWLEGFKASGGELPLDFDVLRQCQVAMKAARPVRTPDEIRNDLHELYVAVDGVETALTIVQGKLGLFDDAMKEAPNGQCA
jgi:hypothetical protein